MSTLSCSRTFDVFFFFHSFSEDASAYHFGLKVTSIFGGSFLFTLFFYFLSLLPFCFSFALSHLFRQLMLCLRILYFLLFLTLFLCFIKITGFWFYLVVPSPPVLSNSLSGFGSFILIKCNQKKRRTGFHKSLTLQVWTRTLSLWEEQRTLLYSLIHTYIYTCVTKHTHTAKQHLHNWLLSNTYVGVS